MGRPVRAAMTSCKDAIKVFEGSKERNPDGSPAEEAGHVKLYFMKPPITKLDTSALSVLTECYHLALSSNSIDKMVNLGTLEKLEILSLGRNNIKRFEHLDAIADHLEQLWMSYNQISSLSGLEKCTKLKILYIGNNKIQNLDEIKKLQSLPALEEIVLYGNPVWAKIVEDGDLQWPIAILKMLPNIKKLDGISVVEWKVRISEGNEKKLEALFKMIDADGSGDISVNEMRAAMKDDEVRREMGVSKQSAEDVFNNMDDDDSGSITWEEFREYFSTKTDLATLIKASFLSSSSSSPLLASSFSGL